MAELTGGPFISEFHYDNAGADTGEFVEVCVPAGSSAAGFTLELHNDNGGTVYDSFELDAALHISISICHYHINLDIIAGMQASI